MKARSITKIPALVVIVLGASIAGACGGGGASPATSSAASPQGASSCDADSKKAVDRVNAAVEANMTCAADADCKNVDLKADCFDACATPTNAAGEEAVKKAIAEANANECKSFAAAGCKITIPPCAPPMPPVCRDGKCHSGAG